MVSQLRRVVLASESQNGDQLVGSPVWRRLAFVDLDRLKLEAVHRNEKYLLSFSFTIQIGNKWPE